MFLGAVAYLNPPSDNFIYDFTLIEVYGGGHLFFPRAGTEVRVDTIYGDDAGYIHVPPFNTLNMTGTSEFKRINVTWAPYVYENAIFVLPNGTVEIRRAESLSYSNIQRSSQVTFWGIVLGYKAHLMVGYGATVSFATSCPRDLKFVGITVQKTSQLIVNSNAENVSDGWIIDVAKDHGTVYREGVVTIEGDGSFIARSLTLKAVSLVVDLRGILTLNGKGYIAGKNSNSVKRLFRHSRSVSSSLTLSLIDSSTGCLVHSFGRSFGQAVCVCLSVCQPACQSASQSVSQRISVFMRL